MNVILDMVISPNGMIAREDGREDWLPHEGWEDMLAQIAKYDNIVVGRETYEVIMREYADGNFDDVTARVKVIVTRNKAYRTPEGYCVAHSPEEAVEIVRTAGLDTVYLIGGGKLNGSFAAAGLITDLQVTIQPYVIGRGRPIFADADFDMQLVLMDSRVVSLGRVVNRYKVIY